MFIARPPILTNSEAPLGAKYAELDRRHFAPKGASVCSLDD
jgi:hypothetical protein